jgi:two-component system alkaline phosphatase synthesis response regulator PhoP
MRPSPVPARLLLVLDHPESSARVRQALGRGHYVTRLVRTAEEMAASVREWQPLLAIVDLDIANGRLLDRLDATMPRAGRVPIVALTRRRDLPTKLAAFEQGADDILTVPFFPEELAARILALLRRAYRTAIPFAAPLRLGEIEIDSVNRTVRVGGRDLRLTALEHCLLYLLAANAGRIVTRDEILDHLWGVDFAAESNVIDRHIRNLRHKLHDDWQRPRYIATVPGRGYRFVTAPAETAAPAPSP